MRIKNIVGEEAAGVGKITKQNTTVDVKPGETRRQAAKFGNKVDKDGRPPELHKKARKNSNAHVLTNLGMAESKNTISGKRMLKMFQGMHHEAEGNKEMDQFILDHDWQAGYLSPDMIPDYEELFDYDDPFGRIIDVDLEHHVNTDEPVIVGPQYSDGKYSIIDGNHRVFIAAERGKGVPAFFPVKAVTESKKLNEVFNKKYPWRWFDQTENRWAATFKSPDGGLFEVFFLPKSRQSPNWIVNFDRDGSHRRSNKGYELPVFATVLDIIKEFFSQEFVDSIEFSAYKEYTDDDDSAKKPDSRAGLYTRMVNRFATAAGLEFEYATHEGETQFLIRKPENTVKEVAIDNVKGRGAVPNNQEIDYFGMRTKMRPSMFLKLAAPLAGGPNDEMVDYIRQGGAIGAPFLIVDVPEDLNKDIPHVAGHEGRNRMKAVMKAEGDDPIEVHLFFRGAVNRARHLTKEIVNLLKAGAYQERTGRHVPGPLWEGNYPVAPHDEWYGDRQYREQGAQMKMMSPDQYLSRVRPLRLDDESEENIEDLMNHIRSGRTLDPLKIYPDGKEDGRHRAYAAKRLGIKRVPVIIWPQKTDESIKRIRRDKKTKFGVKINEYEPEGKKIAMMGPFEIWMTDTHSDYNTPAAQIWDPINNKMAGFIALGGKEGDEYAKYETGVLADKTFVTGTAVVHDHYAGMGLVTRGYITLLQNGFVLVSDQLQTAGGEKIWRKLATTPGINVYAAHISQKDNEVTYSAVDPDDIEDSNYKVYRDEETAEIHGEIGKIQVKRDLLAHRVKKMKEKIDAGRKVDMAKYEDAADQVAVMDRELEMLMREYERSKKDDISSHKVRLMAVADNIKTNESITEAEQQIPVNQKYNQDRGNLGGIVIQIEKTIEELGDDLDVLVKTVNWDQLTAAQDHLSPHGGGDPVFPDIPEDYWEYPVIARVGREFIVIDGHHRLNRDLAAGESEAEGLIFDIKTNEMQNRSKRQQVNEAFDKVLPIRWLRDDIAVAETPNGNQLKISFGEYGDGYEIEFAINNETSATKAGEQMPIFATVLEAIRQFTEKHDPNSYRFSAEKFSRKRQDTRISLYTRMVKRFASSINMDFELKNEGHRTLFILTKKLHESNIQKPHPQDTLGVKRRDMPQVHRDHYPELIDYLKDHGNRFTNKEVHAHELKATQGEFSDKGVRKMMRTGGRPSDSRGKDKKPLIVSADNYIIDGHHRWLAAWNQDDVVPIMKSSLPIRQLFQLIKDFRHTTYKDIHDSYTPLEVAIMEGGHSLEDLAESRIMGVPTDRNYMPDEFDDVEISRKKLIGKINDKFNLWFVKSKYPQNDGEYLLIVEDENKNRIGMAMLYLAKNDIPEYDMKNLYSVALVYVDSSYANQNIGLEMYTTAIKSGISLLSDHQQTLGGQKLWKRLSQYPGVEVYATAIYTDYDKDESRVVISDIDYDEFGDIDSSFFVYDDDYTDEEVKLRNQLSQARKMLKSLKSMSGKKSADRQDQIVTLKREIQAITDELNTFNDEDESYSDIRLMATRSNSIKENMSITGTERQRSERDKKLTPGSEAWFRHWFSRPFLKREQVEQLKQEAVNHIKGARHEKATNRRRPNRNIRTNERRSSR